MAVKNYFVHIDLNQNELLKAVLENQGLAPVNAKDGQIYYNTSSESKGAHVYKTNAWKRLLDIDDLLNLVTIDRTINNKSLSSNITLYSTDIPVSSTDATTVKDYIDNLDIAINGAASTIKDDDLTQNRAVISNADGKIAVSTTTSTELGYVHGVTSDIQTQLDNKVTKQQDYLTAATKCKITYNSDGLVTNGVDLSASDIPDLSSIYINVNQKGSANGVATLDANTLVPAAQLPAATTTTKGAVIVDSTISSSSTNPVQNSAINTALSGKQATITGGASTITTNNLTASRALISNASGKVAVSEVTSTELGYLSGVNENIQDQIDDLQARGRFLSLWNGATGKPETNPGALPFEYKTGDYYIVDNTGATNYRPNGSSYTGAASTVVEIESIAANDVYYYDGTNWLLQVNSQREVSFASITGQPTDNTNLANALNLKANLASPAFTGTPTAPTAATGTNTTQVATTAFVQDAISNASLTLAVNNTALTQSGGVCTWTITNTLNNADVICSVREVSSGEEVETSKTYTASNIVIKMNSSTNIAANTYRAVIIGQKINS
ncbi:MAG: hypothetical protein IJ880_00440 [Bacilli bacterium]|nr:hypothetical protein [Bacilli bacterium]